MTKNWVRLQVEPVEVAADVDDALLFTTVQSVVPGAHGLYYRENGQKKSLNFDQTGRVVAPPTGWHSQNIYIHLAHGHRHGTHFADYSKANEQFEKNISAVQKLIAAAGLTAGFRPTRTGYGRSKVRSGFEAQPENVHISDESDSANNSASLPVIEQAQSSPPPTTGEVEELKLQIKELKHQLSEAKKSNELEKKDCKKKKSKDEKMEMLDAIQQEQAELIKAKDEKIGTLIKQLDTANTTIHDLKEKDEEINNLHTVIEGLRVELAGSQKDHKELHVSLVDHQELLKNAKDKLVLLETQVASYDGPSPSRPRSRNTSESHDEGTRNVRTVEAKLQAANTSLRNSEAEKQKLQEANWYANEKVTKLEKENGYLKGASEEMRNRLNSSSDAKLLAEKERLISEMAEERARLEWRLGELNQWWNDAKWKVGELEAGVAHQRYLLDTANQKIQSLNEQLIVALRAPLAVPSFVNPTYSVKNQFGGMWQLANNSFSLPTTVPMVPVPTPSSMPCISSDVRRIAIQIENPDNKEVFILSSFLNWQAALRCDLQLDGKAAIVVDLPRGRHEFRFLVDGKWCTSSHFPTVPNGFGASNNLLVIE